MRGDKNSQQAISWPLTDCKNWHDCCGDITLLEGLHLRSDFIPLLQFIIFLSCCVNNVKLPLSFLHSPNPLPLSTSLCHRDSSLPPMSPPSSNYLHFIENWILRFRRPEKILWAKFSCKLICLSIKILSGIDRAETVKRYIRIGELFIVMNFGQNTILRAEFLLFSVSSGWWVWTRADTLLSVSRQESQRGVLNKIFLTLCEGILPRSPALSWGDSDGWWVCLNEVKFKTQYMSRNCHETQRKFKAIFLNTFLLNIFF